MVQRIPQESKWARLKQCGIETVQEGKIDVQAIGEYLCVKEVRRKNQIVDSRQTKVR
jgi:hypothetical protein